MEGLPCSNTVVFEGFLPSLMEALVLETAIAVSKALALSLFMMGSLPGGSSILPEESGTSQGFPLTEPHTKKKSDPDSQDASDTEDDEGDDDGDGQDDEDEDDEPGKDSEDGGDPEDEPEVNGDAGSDDNDDEEEEEDEDDDDDDTDRIYKVKELLVKMEGLLCSNTVVSESFLSSLMEAVVLETAIATSKALALSLFMIGFLPTRSSIFPEESGTSQRFPLTVSHTNKKPNPENQDGSDTEDDEEDGDEDGQEDGDEDEEGDDEDEPVKDSKDGDDPEDEPETNGDDGSGDDEDGEEDGDEEEDEDDEDDEDEDDEDDEDDEEDIPQPPAKRRK
ncbi:hypothetical protein SADUNF_Sadunf06G0207800 [Salix dunnii]|uniref:Uncharacterized protein n=1 Tax=Salix dunnii TaxID=1413687 RepID=A0A835K5Q4_9ROSI|nr:hypothetical protein SADUNF_Sadunf06G0207800 [Salix dunnii]